MTWIVLGLSNACVFGMQSQRGLKAGKGLTLVAKSSPPSNILAEGLAMLETRRRRSSDSDSDL